MNENMRIGLAEMFGTAVLVIGGPGTAILSNGAAGQLGVALAFGLALFVIVGAIGHISGCHINPAVTIGLWAARRVETAKLPFYFVGQVVGGLIGALVVFVIAAGRHTPGLASFSASQSGFASNGYGVHSPGGYNLASVVVVELVCTAIFVFVILAATRKAGPTTMAGLTIGLTLTLVHLVSIPVSNTSVNPARSIATAVIQHGWALRQLWVFIAVPLLGGIVAAILWLLLNPEELHDWELAGEGAPPSPDPNAPGGA